MPDPDYFSNQNPKFPKDEKREEESLSKDIKKFKRYANEELLID
ncbi:MAG: hypothetical protein Q8N99_03820 [Nanoarchaeota archaeon]|nr:hypothetical protein [Nanoarchaeota archaeon]